jgi:hypothetical protein
MKYLVTYTRQYTIEIDALSAGDAKKLANLVPADDWELSKSSMVAESRAERHSAKEPRP